MEFAERRRSRKSQSFKLINDQAAECHSDQLGSGIDHVVNGDSKESESEAWLEDDGMEIKRQITGMMRMLNDKAGRVYQRVGKEGENLKQEPANVLLTWAQPTDPDAQESLHSSWGCVPQASQPLFQDLPGTRSKTQKIVNLTKDLGTMTGDMALSQSSASSVTTPSCCTCNCKSTLQAILLELRTMRKLMQTQKGSQDKQVAPSSPCSARCPVARKRARKRRPVHRVAPLTTPSNGTPTTPQSTRERTVPSPLTAAVPSSSPSVLAQPGPHYTPVTGASSTEPEVQLAEDYNVFIPKSQLDSILVNYTRSGSLLFRKLVCAFFDDTTLANSLPNGKRKRGLNDHRKGLDQDIVGAIKIFTENYCTANKIERLPGARDWVQILQDQIKLARRRLKRAETAADGNESQNRPAPDNRESPDVATLLKQGDI